LAKANAFEGCGITIWTMPWKEWLKWGKVGQAIYYPLIINYRKEIVGKKRGFEISHFEWTPKQEKDA